MGSLLVNGLVPLLSRTCCGMYCTSYYLGANSLLSELVAAHKPSNLSVYVSDDGAVYMDKVTELATSGGTTEWKPVLIIIPARLGLDSVNEIYYPPILETFKFPQSLGILGGKPRASLYFVAAQGMR